MSKVSDRRTILRAMGLCVECKTASKTRRCPKCSKRNEADRSFSRLDGLANKSWAPLHRYEITRGERRRNGLRCAALDWALLNHRLRFSEQEV